MAQVSILAGGAPVADTVLVTADQETIFGSGTALDPLRTTSSPSGGGNTFNAQVVSSATPGPFLLGTAAFVAGVVGSVTQVGRTLGNTNVACAGLCVLAASGVSQPTRLQYAGIVTLTTAQWDAIAGTTGGLSAGDPYWVSESSAGHLTDVEPTTGHTVTLIGMALSPTELQLNIQVPKLS